jgi:hypothetical protein
LADFNGDGKLDLAVASSQCAVFSCPATGPGSVFILLGFGDGTFVGEQEYAFQTQVPPVTVLSADSNGDGKPDLAAESQPFQVVSSLGVFLGNGDGTFQPEIPTSLTQSSSAIAAGDFNGDGKADLATLYPNCANNTCLPGDVVVLIGNGDGTFQSPAEYAVGLQSQSAGGVAVGDFNGDGKPDLAVSNPGANTVSILLNNGDGTFQPHVD